MRELEWDIRPAADRCAACGRTYDDGEALVSLLRQSPEGYERLDLCRACGAEKAGDDSLSSWQGIFHAPLPPQPEPLKKETAESLLRRLMETEEERQGSAIFILAVMLERRRVLVEKEVRRQPDGSTLRVYEHRHTGEAFIIPDPQLRLSELESVQEEVVLLLGGQPPRRDGRAKEARPAAEPASG